MRVGGKFRDAYASRMVEELSSPPPTSEQIGKYQLQRKLGEGGMGTVYAGVHTGIGQRVAIKLLRPDLCADTKQVQRFFDEARLVSMVSHPGLIKIMDFDKTDDGRIYIVMELLEGESLYSRLEKHRQSGQTLPPDDTLRLMRQITSALSAVHKKGIVHRDLKPENIFIVPDPDTASGERAKILDFGIARLEDGGGEGRRTTTGVALGTPTYMAPEQCEGRPQLSDRVDVYALAVLWFELLTGAPPFRAESASAIMRQHLVKTPPPLPSSVAPELGTLIHAMLAKEPEQRPSMTDIASQLDQLFGASGSRAAQVAVRQPIASRRTMVAGLALVAVVMGGIFYAQRGRRVSPSPISTPAPDMQIAALPALHKNTTQAPLDEEKPSIEAPVTSDKPLLRANKTRPIKKVSSAATPVFETKKKPKKGNLL